MNYDNTQVVIDLDAIEKNIAAVKEKTGLPVMGIIKADAYGHGAIQVARLLQDKCAFFGVSSMLEAMELRRAGLETPILILGYTPVTAFPNAIRYGIRPSIFHYEDALALSQAAVDLGVTQAPFHFALDTGMSRIGFQATAAAADQCARIANLPGLRAEGLFTHFATADSSDLTRSKKQAELFYRFDEMLKARGINIPIRHLDNSAGIMNFDYPCEMVRSGIITYGLYPSDEVDPSVLSLTPALSWRCRITHLKLLEAGREIELRRHLHHHPAHPGSHHPRGLCRRLPAEPIQPVLCPHSWEKSPHPGPGLHGPADGRRNGYPRNQAGGHRSPGGPQRPGGDLHGANRRGGRQLQL